VRTAPPTEDRYLPMPALAGYSGLSVRTLRGYLVHQVHPLPHYRIGGRVLVKQSDFDVWAKQFRVTPTAAPIDALVDDVLAGVR
jgi:elongation factor P hydroxylase